MKHLHAIALVYLSLVVPAWAGFELGHDALKFGEYDGALRELRPLGDKGHAKAQDLLGEMYRRGWGVSQDYKKAMIWHLKAAQQGEAHAQYNVGEMYARGRGVAQDFVQAVKWWRMAARQDHDLAQNNLAAFYAKGRGVTKDLKEAVKWWRMAAEQGAVSAQQNLGYMYAADEGVALDLVQAHMWLNVAASRHTSSKWKGRAIKHRDSVAKRMKPAQIVEARTLARQRLEWAAEMDGVTAYNLGDYARALRELPALAEHGDDEAQYRLGLIYGRGEGVPRNPATAVKWWQMAAEQNNPDAQFVLGHALVKGQGVTQNVVEAAKLWRKAAEQGHPEAQFNMGNMFAVGQGVAQDLIKAHMWFNVAASRYTRPEHKDDAILERDKASTQMRPTDIVKARKLAQEWWAGFQMRKGRFQ